MKLYCYGHMGFFDERLEHVTDPNIKTPSGAAATYCTRGRDDGSPCYPHLGAGAYADFVPDSIARECRSVVVRFYAGVAKRSELDATLKNALAAQGATPKKTRAIPAGHFARDKVKPGVTLKEFRVNGNVDSDFEAYDDEA